MNYWKSDFVRLRSVRGWLLDIYPSKSGEMIVWVITENGERVRLVDKFAHRIYVYGSFSDLKCLAEIIGENRAVAGWRFVEKYVNLMNASKGKVLEVDVRDHRKTTSFARKLLRIAGYEKFRLYNIDIPISEAYLYDKEIFPLAYVVAVDYGDRLWYDVTDSAESFDYTIPPLRSMWLNANIKSKGAIQKLNDKIDNISLVLDDDTIVINDGSEADKILELVRVVGEEDPDIVYTREGDSFLFPYLAYRAYVNGVLESFVLSRDNIPLKMRKGESKTFSSYGRVHRKAAMRRLYGRIHIDVNNTFIYKACGLEGLFEVSRTCRVSIHKAARASIGSIMSSLQLFTAWKDDILIPWRKREPESFKSASELLMGDRGGFVFEPKIGFHTDVLEVDFTSMFPMLMLTRNISAETVLCECCPNSKLTVPELGYNICEKRRGIVPKTLDFLLNKRLRYKLLMREACDERLRHIYDMRQTALKWILVTCFGYLGYRNARFGKVDAHIAVCALARDILLKTAKWAEKRGFEVIHGIVDSLWLKKKGISHKEVNEFCCEVSKAMGVPLGFEGIYRWIIFLPSKILEGVPVLNRYYGVFKNGEIKNRGIEARHADAPHLVRKAQMDMIRKLKAAYSLESFKAKIPEALRELRRYCDKLISKQVDIEDLLIAKRLSKSPSGYIHDVFQAIAAKQLEKAGFEVHAGQTIQYLIVNSKNKRPNNRVLAAKLLKYDNQYDTEEYLDMLISAAETLFVVFGYPKSKIREQVLNQEKQILFG